MQIIFDGNSLRFIFSIPKGDEGQTGTAGQDGQNVAPGEVTNAQLSTAIAGIRINSNTVATLGLAISDPPTQSEEQGVLYKLSMS